MAGIHELSAYQQTAQKPVSGDRTERNKPVTGAKTASGAKSASGSGKTASASSPEVKPWSPVKEGSSLIPAKGQYGFAVGDVKLSDDAAKYYDSLKSKFHNMDFIVVSSDMKAKVQQNAAAYGNANKQVVLIDEEKLERMATDEDYRNKYEGIIAMSQSRLLEAKNSLAASGAPVKNFGMSVDSSGTEKFFATVEKSGELQKQRLEKKAQEKKEQKAAEKKKAAKEAAQDRIDKAREKKKAEKAEKAEGSADEADAAEIPDDKEYVTLSSNSLGDLISKVQTYSYNNASARVMTDAERAVGGHIDFRG